LTVLHSACHAQVERSGFGAIVASLLGISLPVHKSHPSRT
jgi:hypothetical protein